MTFIFLWATQSPIENAIFHQTMTAKKEWLKSLKKTIRQNIRPVNQGLSHTTQRFEGERF